MKLDTYVHIIDRDYPMDKALCQFMPNYGDPIFGYFNWKYDAIIQVGNRVSIKIKDIKTYRYILNDKGGMYFIK
jgi:hypothetical protein